MYRCMDVWKRQKRQKLGNKSESLNPLIANNDKRGKDIWIDSGSGPEWQSLKAYFKVVV